VQSQYGECLKLPADVLAAVRDGLGKNADA